MFHYFDRVINILFQTKIDKISTSIFYPNKENHDKLHIEVQDGLLNFEKLLKKAASTYLKLLLSNNWNSDSKLDVDGW